MTLYKYFPFSHQLIERLEQFLFGSWQRIEHIENFNDELKNLLGRDFEDRRSILYKMTNFKNIFSRSEFVFNPLYALE